MDDLRLSELIGGDIGTDTVNTFDVSGDEGIGRESGDLEADNGGWEHAFPFLSLGDVTGVVLAVPKREVGIILEFTEGRFRKADDGVTVVKKGLRVNLCVRSGNLSEAKLVRLEVGYYKLAYQMPVHLDEKKRDPSKPENVRFQVFRVHLGEGVSYKLDPTDQHCYVEVEVQSRIKDGSSFDLPLEFLGLTSEGHGKSADGWILRCQLLDSFRRIVSEGSMRMKSVSELRLKSGGQKRTIRSGCYGTGNVKREFPSSRSPSRSPLHSHDCRLTSCEAEVRRKYDNKRAKLDNERAELDEEEQEDLDRIRRAHTCV